MALKFIAFLVVLVIAFILLGVSIASKRALAKRGGPRGYDDIVVPGFVPGAAFGIAMLLLLFSCVTIVGTRDIGIVTSFGRPVAHLNNGLHAKAPWDKVSTLDGAIQTDSYTGRKHCTDIRIGNESTACVDNSIRWRINPNASDSLFRDYHTMENIRDSLVTRELKAALNNALSDYNPLNEIQANAQGAKPSLSKFSAAVKQSLQQQVGGQVEVLNVIIPLIRFDSSTQTKINAYQAEVANTRIAQQKEQTATAQAAANKILSKSVSKDPNVLVSKCLDTQDEAIRNSVTLPAAGLGCWPGNNNAVVVPSASAK